MVSTQADLDALIKARNSGVLRVDYDGRSITYRSAEDIKRLIGVLERDLNKAAGVKRTRRFLPYAVKGL